MSKDEDLIESFKRLLREQGGPETVTGGPNAGSGLGGGGDYTGAPAMPAPQPDSSTVAQTSGGGGTEYDESKGRKALLCDKCGSSTHVEKRKGQYTIEGKFINCDVKTKNSRIYPSEVVRESMKEVIPRISEGSFFSHLGHGDKAGTDPHRVSSIITSLKKDGSSYHGKAKVLDTPSGRILHEILDKGALYK